MKKLLFSGLALCLTACASADNSATVRSETLVAAPAAVRRPMLPAVKSAEFSGEKYRPAGGDTTIAFRSESEPARLARAVKRVLGEQSGIDVEALNLTVEPYPEARGEGQSEEQYTLKVTPDGILIRAFEPRGAFYALQTLRNLYDPATGAFDCADVTDYPDLPYRGAMFLVDCDSLTFHKNLIEQILAPLKMNKIVMECEYAAWDTSSGIHHPRAISKDDLRELVRIADENYLDSSPLFQTLGHCEWLFGVNRDQNLDWAEEPTHPYAYYVNGAGLYEFMDSILDEIVDVFHQPEYLHIGHDEVFLESVFPARPDSVAKGPRQLVFDDVMHYHSYAEKHGMRLMMWHDMFVTWEESPENGAGGPPRNIAELRKTLPKDIIMVDWRYSGRFTRYPDLTTFRNDGFDVIGGTWYDKGNHEHLIPAVKQAGGLGVLQTIWNGYFGNGTVLYDGFFQVAPYTRSATWSWDVRPESNLYDSHALAAAFLTPRNTPAAAAGYLVDLSAADLSASPVALPAGRSRAGRVEFLIPELNGAAGAVTAPEVGTAFVELGGVKSPRLFLLQTTTTPGKVKDAVVFMRAVYADGSSSEIPVRYGMEVQRGEDDFSFLLSPLNCSGEGADRIYYATWENPHPEKPISRLAISKAPGGHDYYLLGVSAEE